MCECGAWEKEGRDNAAARGVLSRSFSTLIFFYFFGGEGKVHSCMLDETAISTNFLRNYLLAPVTSGRCLDLEIITVKFRRTILQQRVKLTSCVTIKVRVTVTGNRSKNATDKKFDSDFDL